MAEIERRDPDRLLADVQREEARSHRGRLRIFFGASAGVGKTYSMLEAARGAQAGGADVVVGYVEPHGRAETERLLEGMPQLPFLPVRYRGIVRREFDLDAALKRAPAIILVDELAHSNVTEGEPVPRHAKRWQDVEELLDAGIDVWTTLNVQHLESLNDVVAGITGVRQQETLPDRIFDEADEVELIDLPPEDLLARLKAGKVYAPAQASRATESFFRKPNLLALRELALRRTADRVDAAALEFAAQAPTSRPWLARDRFMIAITPDGQAEQLVRIGKRFADALDAEWLVVSVETPQLLKLSDAQRNRRIDVLRLAESLGAETVTIDGASAADALLEYARLRNVTRIVIGEAKRTGWRSWLRRSTTTELVRRGRGFDISVIARRDVREPGGRADGGALRRSAPREIKWQRYWAALAVTACCTAAAAIMYPYFALTNLVMVYLLGATVAALRLGRGPASFTAVANVIALDFCFVPPRFTFAISNLEYLLTFAVMLVLALVIANLVANVRAQTRVAGARERRTSLLYAMSRELAATRSFDNLARVAVKHVAETFSGRAAVLLPDAHERLQPIKGADLALTLEDPDLSVAQWVFDHGRPAGLATDTLPAARAQYLPLTGTQATLGVLAVQPTQRRRLLLPEQSHLLETFAGQIALAIERAQRADEAEAARVAVETESLRNSLLASISHDLRTPLAAIMAASHALGDPKMQPDAETRARLARTIETTAQAISELISNVLDLMSFQFGEVHLHRDWHSVESLVEAALARLEGRLARHPVEVMLPADLPAVNVDAALITRALVNLLENAVKHTPGGTHIRVSAGIEGEAVRIVVDDDGPGLPPGPPEQLFAKFERGNSDADVGGAGLGLAICKAIVDAHGGRISAGPRPGGGARFTLTLPTVAAHAPAPAAARGAP
ncbi:MAG TPA: sensor histidine kinase KdpD [Steroidobacteraceae bacterium]|nr:sensor histidine kinase KdpD [Steroidobacteraceae bacterium]